MIKYLSLFSGIGAFEKALNNQEIDFQLTNYCEIDKYASKSYSLIHGIPEDKNLWDITKVNEKTLGEVDFVTYGFPCQDISLAGKQKGLFNEDGSQTRSGLFFDALRIITHTQPKVAIAENVKNLTGKKFNEQFKIVLSSLEEAGYNNYWKVLNAKDYGIPQNRERVFIVSIRKDLDHGRFKFPEPYELKKRLKDLLENTVDDKYYLENPFNVMNDGTCRTIKSQYYKNSYANFIKQTDQGATGVQVVCNVNPSGRGQNGTVVSAEGLARTITTEKGEGQKILVDEPKVIQIGNCHPTKTRDNPNQGRIYSTDGLSPALTCMGGGNLEPHVIVRENTKKGYAEAFDGDSINLEQPNSKTRRGRVGHQIAQTLTTSPQQAAVVKLRIRKLTPKECFRLMGFADKDHDICSTNGISNTQLYKEAGNSIVVDTAEELLCMMFNGNGNFFI